MTDEFEFVSELPPAYDPAKRPSKYEPFIEALRRNPGQWAKLPYTGNNHTQVASAIRNGGGPGRVTPYKAFEPRSSFEVVVRKREIYVRFLAPGMYASLSDVDVITKVISLDDERSYGDRDTGEIEAEAAPYEEEAKRRYGADAMENLAEYCVEYHATSEDLLASIERAGNADAIVSIMKGEK